MTCQQSFIIKLLCKLWTVCSKNKKRHQICSHRHNTNIAYMTLKWNKYDKQWYVNKFVPNDYQYKLFQLVRFSNLTLNTGSVHIISLITEETVILKLSLFQINPVNGRVTAAFFFVHQTRRKLRGLSPRANYTDRATDRRLSAKLVSTFGDRRVSRSQSGRSLTAVISVSRLEPLPFLSSSSSILLTRLSGPRSRPTTSQEIW
jgi:hypothetical protein